MSKKIKEFDLDAPALEKSERSEFRYQARSLTNLFERCFFGSIKVGKAWKILVEVVPEVVNSHHRDLLGVLTIETRGDPKAMIAATGELEKRELALSWLLEGVRKLATELKIDNALFLAAANRVRALGFENVRAWLKPIVSPIDDFMADVVVDHGVHEAKIIGRILREDGTVESEHFLLSERPDEFMYAPLLGSLVWLDGATVELRSKAGDRAWHFRR